WAGAPAAIRKIEPAAVILADADTSPAPRDALSAAIAAANAVYMPVIERCRPATCPIVPAALPIAAAAPPERVVARLAVALRVRTLDASVRRRAATLGPSSEELPDLSAQDSVDPLDDATVLVLGRGRAYPELSVAVGERVGLIGALSVENAARHLNARDVDGV